MRPLRRLALAAAVALAAPRVHAADTPAGTPPATAAGNPVVVELFTAQGCSSCPPADRLLSKMATEPEWQGRLIPLGFHVDYWNFGGWTDPFSAGVYTDRQNGYMKDLPPGRGAYTPQAIVNGRKVCVGSDERVLRQLLAEAAAAPAGKVELSLKRDGSKIVADIVAAPPSGFSGNLEVNFALVEDGLETEVKAGENAHRTLHDDFVVRRFQRAFKIRGGEQKDSVSVRLERGWKGENMRVAVFLQDPETRAIVGAASAPIPR